MISRIEGILVERTPTRVVVDVRGVGYEASIPLSTFSQLPEEGKTVMLRIHTHVREDVLQLYGFATLRERAVFQLLLHASRVGPKLAQTILSGLDAGALAEAIRSGNVERLKSLPGVGSKTAERIVVELRDRVDDALAEGSGPIGPGTPVAVGEDRRAQLVSTLVNLQIPRAKAERVGDVVLAEQPDAPIEELVRAALQGMAR